MSALPTIVTYAVLTCLWSAILALYLRHRRGVEKRDPLAAMLLSVLALDAVKSVLESSYFGLVWATQYGLLGDTFAVLGRPGPMMAVKLFNGLVAVLVLFRLIRVWLPSHAKERDQQREKLEGAARHALESEESFRAAFQTTPDATCIVRLEDGVNMAVNENYCRMSGWSEAEALGVTSASLNLWVDLAQRALHTAALRTAGVVQGQEVQFRRKDGTTFFAELSSRVYTAGGQKYFFTIARDISEKKRAESVKAALFRIAEAASSGGSLQQLLGAVHRAVAELMPAPNFYIALYDAAQQRFEFPYGVDERGDVPKEPVSLGRGLTEYVLRTGKPFAMTDRAQFEALVRTGEVEQVGEPCHSWVGVPLRTQERTVGVLAAQIYEGKTSYGPAHTELLQFVSTQVARAIEVKRGEEAVRKSERRFRALIESTSDGVCLLDPDGALRYASPATAHMLGSQQGRLVDLLNPEDVPGIQRKLDEAMQRPSTPVVAQGRPRARGGAAALELVFTNLLDEPAVRGVVVNLRDLSERKQLEGRLMAADRLVSIGTLAAGVAHEINNPLAYVIANLALLADDKDAVRDPGSLEALQAAQEGAERVRQIVRDLKTFSRADETVRGPVDVHKVLDATTNIAWNEIRHRARLVRDYAAELPPVMANEGRLGQVVLNLLVNAAQAMPEGNVEQNQIRLSTRSNGAQVIIEVSDTGRGIPEENRARLFEPFFTTKPVGVGTGLGLYLCQQIVSSMGGTIAVESTPGQGSRFRVELPVAGAVVRPLPALQVPAASRRARILAVDDEPRLGQVLKHALNAHDVVDLTSATEALDRIRQGEKFDLIFCDLMMPLMTGMDLHAALERDAPDQARRMVFLTGGAFTHSARQFLDRVQNPRLDKPFQLDSLRAFTAEQLRVLEN